MSPSSTADLNFAFTSDVFMRTFEIKINQYACHSLNRPPTGCLQYHTGTEGRLTTFNFDADLHHLNNQLYNICIRQELGFCCTKYHVCSDATSAFTLDDIDTDTSPDSKIGTQCSDDYIEIEGSSNVCNGKTFYNRYCGDLLTTYAFAGTHASVCGGYLRAFRKRNVLVFYSFQIALLHSVSL